VVQQLNATAAAVANICRYAGPPPLGHTRTACCWH
jgi:hypothetical protein